MRVAGCARSQERPENGHASSFGFATSLEDQDGGSLTQREPVPISSERSAWLRRHRTQRVEAGVGQLTQTVGPTTEHNVDLTAA